MYYQVPFGKGERIIICLLGSPETGLLHDCMLMLRGKKSNRKSDYHTDMHSHVFLDFFANKVFQEQKRRGKSFVVLDRATYHTMLTDGTKPPRLSWTKKMLSDAIDR